MVPEPFWSVSLYTVVDVAEVVAGLLELLGYSGVVEFIRTVTVVTALILTFFTPVVFLCVRVRLVGFGVAVYVTVHPAAPLPSSIVLRLTVPVELVLSLAVNVTTVSLLDSKPALPLYATVQFENVIVVLLVEKAYDVE